MGGGTTNMKLRARAEEINIEENIILRRKKVAILKTRREGETKGYRCALGLTACGRGLSSTIDTIAWFPRLRIHLGYRCLLGDSEHQRRGLRRMAAGIP